MYLHAKIDKIVDFFSRQWKHKLLRPMQYEVSINQFQSEFEVDCYEILQTKNGLTIKTFE